MHSANCSKDISPTSVSYTHLDVYKRQGAYLRIAVKPLHPCRRPCIQLAALYAVVEVHADDTAAVELKAHALITVSYTHLDVYKRQGLYRLL